jgi:rhodanese-related sulfurtransferase
MQEIDVTEAAQRLSEDPDNTILLDVREDMELDIARIPFALHIPMGETPARLAELDADKTIICMCHHGGRSAQVAAFLAAQGYTQALNLAGGINAWSDLVDPSIPRY